MVSSVHKSKSGGSRSRRRGKKMRGGYTSAASFQVENLGNANDQYHNTFIRWGPFGASIQNLAGTQQSVVAGSFPSAANLKLIQSAGSKRRKIRGGDTNSNNSDSRESSIGGKRRSRRAKRGGYWGNVISQALVPFSLLFAQNRYGTRKHRK